MGSHSSRRLERGRDPKTDLKTRRAAWEFFFYRWRWLVILIPATAQAVEVVVALIEGRSPNLVIRIPSEDR